MPNLRLNPEIQTDHTVDPNAAEHLLGTLQLGQRIRRMRLKRSMGLVELGKLTGLSASFLSQLETGRVVPTLRNLVRISLIFEKDLSYFFDNENRNSFRIQRAKDRLKLKIGTPSPTYISESFGIVIPEEGLRPCMAEFLPGNREPFQPDPTPGVEMVYVISGKLGLTRSGQEYELGEHDAVYISSETERAYRALGQSPAKAMIITFDSDFSRSN